MIPVSAVSALSNSESIATCRSASAASALAISASIDALMLVTAVNNASSLAISIELTKSTTSLNWSKSTVEPSKIASILPFSTSMLDCNLFSASIALFSSADTAATLSLTSLLIKLFRYLSFSALVTASASKLD